MTSLWKRHFDLRVKPSLVVLRKFWETLQNCYFFFEFHCNSLSCNFPYFRILTSWEHLGRGVSMQCKGKLKYHQSPIPNYRRYKPCMPYCSVGVIDLRISVCSIKYWNIQTDAPDLRVKRWGRFPFRKHTMPFLTVDTIIDNQALQNGGCHICFSLGLDGVENAYNLLME